MGCFQPAYVVPSLNKAERNHGKLLTFAFVSRETTCAVLNPNFSGKHGSKGRTAAWAEI